MKKLDYRQKPIIAMLHLKGGDKMTEIMLREAQIYYDNGVDAVLVENYFGTKADCAAALSLLRDKYPDKCYGVNILGDYRKAFALAREYGAGFVQIDSVCGHLYPDEDSLYAKQLAKAAQGREFDILGGLRFKYQPIHSGRTLAEDTLLAKMRCDAIVTTGDGTGHDTPTEKLIEIRSMTGDFPLIVGAGVTAFTVREKLLYTDGVIVGSWLKDNHIDSGDVNESYVRQFMQAARG